METGIIEIELRGHEKWKARSDVKRPNWFKCSNDLFDDDDLFEFEPAEMAAWVYILAQCSKQQSKCVRISIKKASVRFPPKLLLRTVDKLIALGIVTRHEPGTLRARNADVPLEEKREEEIREEERAREDAPPAASDQISLGEDLKLEAALQGNSLLEQVLPTIPKGVRKSWLETYEPSWLKLSLIKAIEHHLSKTGVRSPTELENWQKKFTNWLKIERDPKYRKKQSPDKVREIRAPWPTGSKERSLGEMRAVDAMKKVVSGGAS